MTSGIYQITNITNGKFYIGSSQDIERRWREHKYSLNHNGHHNKHLQNAWNKYGEDSFYFSILLKCQLNELLDCEQVYFERLKPQYNHAFIAGTNRGIKRSEQARLNMSLAHLGKPSGAKGTKRSPETRAKLSAINKGKKRVFTDEHRARLSVAGMGHAVSEEARKKMSLAKKGITPWNKGKKNGN